MVLYVKTRSMTKTELIDFLRKKPSYLKKGKKYLSNMFNMKQADCAEALRKVKEEKGFITSTVIKKKTLSSKSPSPFLNGNPNNILVIGDLHEPFCLQGYLEFCRKIQEKMNCGSVLFIGDIIDNHYSSYHETDPDGFSAGEELDRAIAKIADWYKTFPKATVVIGNHDRLVHRKAYSAGVSERWIRKYHEVLDTPNWKFVENIEIDEINFNHGEGGTARSKMKNEIQSQVQGHFHNQAYIEYAVGPTSRIFGMQVGCGVDRKAYAMAYGKNFKKPVISCGTVSEGIPQLHPMML